MCTFPAWHPPDSPPCPLQGSPGRALPLTPAPPTLRVFLAGVSHKESFPASV